MNLKSLKDLLWIFCRGAITATAISACMAEVARPPAVAMSVNYCLPRLSCNGNYGIWRFAWTGTLNSNKWSKLQYGSICIGIGKVCFSAVYLLLNFNYHRKNIIPLTLTIDKMFYSKTWVQNTALTLNYGSRMHVYIQMQCCAVGLYNNKIYISNKV